MGNFTWRPYEEEDCKLKSYCRRKVLLFSRLLSFRIVYQNIFCYHNCKISYCYMKVTGLLSICSSTQLPIFRNICFICYDYHAVEILFLSQQSHWKSFCLRKIEVRL